MKSIFSRAAALATAASASACLITTDDPPPPARTVVVEDPTDPLSTGRLIVDWTIEGVRDPAGCTVFAAAVIEIVVFDAAGIEVGAFEQACTAFATSIALRAGFYSATAALLDAARQPRTTSVDIAPFTITGNDELHIPIDFPVSSFY